MQTFLMILGFFLFYLGTLLDSIDLSLSMGGIESAIAAGGVLITIWAVIVGFSIAFFGLIYQLSPIHPLLKIRLFNQFIWESVSFILLLLLAGSVPFFTILRIKADDILIYSSINLWLIIGFVLQIFLVASAFFFIKQIQGELNFLNAAKIIFSKIKQNSIADLCDSFGEAFKKDFQNGPRQAIFPMSGLGSQMEGAGGKVHEELSLIFKNLFLENDYQVLDAGVSIVADWLKPISIKEIDQYLERRLVPACFDTIRMDQSAHYPYIFKVKLYYMARLLNVLREKNAHLTWSNSQNKFWELIKERSSSERLSDIFEYAWMTVDFIHLITINKTQIPFPILLNNLSNGVSILAPEKTEKSVHWIERIFEMHMDLITKFLDSDLFNTDLWINSIEHIYEQICNSYKDEIAFWASTHDLRYWMLVRLRQVQGDILKKVPPESEDFTLRSTAQERYDSLESLIDNLLTKFCPEGDPVLHKRRYDQNPYV